MFLQNYIYQMATAIALAYTAPQELMLPGDHNEGINWEAIAYGSLELRANIRRYLHFALPCMTRELWEKGLRKQNPTYEQILKKTSEYARYLNNLSYTDRVPSNTNREDVCETYFQGDIIIKEQAFEIRALGTPPLLTTSFSRNIPFFDDGHSYNFFRDNTPYDASYNLLMSSAAQKLVEDGSHYVALPSAESIFTPDEYFVIDRFSATPNGCLGPTSDTSIIKKIQLMMGPEYVKDVAYTSIKDLREMDLWHPTEFDQLVYVSGTPIATKIKNALKGITAPMALYLSWVDKVSTQDTPVTTMQWVHQELSDRIADGEIYDILLDDATLDWLQKTKVAEVLQKSSVDFFVFPNYDRNRYASRGAAERNMAYEDWAWSEAHAHRFPMSIGTKLRGLNHGKYIPSLDVIDSNKEGVAERAPNTRGLPIVPQTQDGYVYTRNTVGQMTAGISTRVKEFLQWARETKASQDALVNALNESAPAGEAPSPVVPGYTPDKKSEHRSKPTQQVPQQKMEPKAKSASAPVCKADVKKPQGRGPIIKGIDLGATSTPVTSKPSAASQAKSKEGGQSTDGSVVKKMNLS